MACPYTSRRLLPANIPIGIVQLFAHISATAPPELASILLVSAVQLFPLTVVPGWRVVPEWFPLLFFSWFPVLPPFPVVPLVLLP